jgi:hypothetical protein
VMVSRHTVMVSRHTVMVLRDTVMVSRPTLFLWFRVPDKLGMSAYGETVNRFCVTVVRRIFFMAVWWNKRHTVMDFRHAL